MEVSEIMAAAEEATRAFVSLIPDSPLLGALFAFVTFFYLPMAVYQTYLMFSGIHHNDDRYFAKQTRLDKANGVIVAITTNGMAVDVVEWIIASIEGYRMDIGIYVIKEERDAHAYSCREIAVPADYVCPNGSKSKMRALQYGIEALHEMGYGSETYICHLDDDSLVDRDYLEYVMHYMTGEGGQGCIRLREFGRHMLSSLADIVRISNCETWCKLRNRKDNPMFVHGEGLVVRADIEHEIGWDYGTYGAEDLIMGLEISRRGTFRHIPIGNIFISPPVTAKDYMKQRRRWFWSIFKTDGKLRRLSLKTYLTYIYMYAIGITGLISLTLLPIVLLSAYAIPHMVLAACLFNIVAFFGYFQFGALFCDRRPCAPMLLLMQIPVAFYDGFSILYALVTRPNFEVFETIKKV